MAHSVTPVAYRLTIEPDLRRFIFDGRMTLVANADEPLDTVTLDCAELAIWQCRIKPNGSDERIIDCSFTLDPAKTRLSIHLPDNLSGAFQLTIDYAGKINDRMAGFYRSRIKADNAPSHIAVTQFQESDARRAFPCLDHPAQKAVFTVGWSSTKT
jgi:aminopeptidase N